MKFEIINPSDKTYIESDDFMMACIATDLISPNYGLKEIDGDREKPPFLLGGANQWYSKKFNMDVNKAFDSIDKLQLASVLESVKSETYSSINEIEKYAHNLAKAIRKKEQSPDKEE